MDLHRSDTTRMTKFSDPRPGGRNVFQHVLKTSQKTPRTRQESMFPRSPHPLPTMTNRVRHLLLRLAIRVDWTATCQCRFHGPICCEDGRTKPNQRATPSKVHS